MSRDEIIEQATKVMHADVCCPCDPQGCDWTRTREARYAHALADAGLLARSLPTRDEIATAIADGWNSVTTLNATAQSIGPSAAADAVLALLKGQDA